jgi:acetylornithine deacetylase/succinyl-diaminopimelate desuccinylase-like protein
LWHAPTLRTLEEEPAKEVQDELLSALSKFVEIPSVSVDPKHRSDCRQGAKFLKSLFLQLGAAETKIVSHHAFSDEMIFRIKFSYLPSYLFASQNIAENV